MSDIINIEDLKRLKDLRDKYEKQKQTIQYEIERLQSQLELLDPWIIQDNKWRATRYGLDSNIIIDENGNLQNIKGMIIDTVEKLLPIANELECTNELSALVDLVEQNKPPYIRQIFEYEKNNDFKDIIKLYVNELEKDLEIEQIR